MSPPVFRKVPLAKPSMGDEEWQAAREPLMSGWLIQGPQVAAFEKAFAAMHRVRHASAVSSATAGLHVALAALDIGPGDEVIVPAFTWVATANAAVYCGATPVFADVDPLTFNIDPADLRKRITPRTKAVVPVHLFGLCADMDAVGDAVPPEVAIVEDAACAAGSHFKGRPAGGMGRLGVFSFHPRKSITTGEGGMVTTDDPIVAARVDALRNHGGTSAREAQKIGARPYLMDDFDVLGFNYRMTDLQAAIGLVQLAKIDKFIDERSAAARRYREELADVAWLRLPTEPNSGRHAWQSFVTYVLPDRAPKARNEIMDALAACGVATRPGTHAVHMLGYYRDNYHKVPDDCPGARDCYVNTMAIPLHNCMNADDYSHVIAAVRSIR